MTIFYFLFFALQERRKRGETDAQVFLGDVYAYQGRFGEAAKLYRKAGQPTRAMNMYTDLRMFDYAKVSSCIALFSHGLRSKPGVVSPLFRY